MVSLGRSPKTGKRRRQIIYGDTKTDVLNAIRKIAPGPAASAAFEAQRMRLREHLERWMEAARGDRHDVGTQATYSSHIKKHINPSIGDVTLGALTPALLQTFLTELRRDGASEHVRSQVYRILHRAMWQAVRWKLLSSNPLDEIDRPRSPARTKTTFTAADARRFLATAKRDRFYIAYLFAIANGLRRGEILGLQKSDLNLRTSAATVQRQVKDVKGKLHVTERKNRKTYVIQLSQPLVGLLRRHISSLPADSPWLFPNSRGGPMGPRNFIGRHYADVLEKAKVPRIRFHDLRHTMATIAIGEGVPLPVVKEMLNHSSIHTTDAFYVDVNRQLQRDAARTMAGVLRLNGTTMAPRSADRRMRDKQKSLKS